MIQQSIVQLKVKLTDMDINNSSDFNLCSDFFMFHEFWNSQIIQ
jgi:hypothetical protein